MGASRRLINDLWRREKRDQLYLLAAMAFLAAVVLYIVLSRVWLAPLTFPLRLLFKAFFGGGKGGSSPKAEVQLGTTEVPVQLATTLSPSTASSLEATLIPGLYAEHKGDEHFKDMREQFVSPSSGKTYWTRAARDWSQRRLLKRYSQGEIFDQAGNRPDPDELAHILYEWLLSLEEGEGDNDKDEL